MSGLAASKTEGRALTMQGTEAAQPDCECPVDAAEAAKFLKMTRSTVLSLARNGIIPAHPIGVGLRKRWLFFLSELEAYVRSVGVNCGGHPCAS